LGITRFCCDTHLLGLGVLAWLSNIADIMPATATKAKHGNEVIRNIELPKAKG